MRFMTCATLTLSLVAAHPTPADTWERSFALIGRPYLKVRANEGSVQVRPWDRPEVGVRVTTAGWRIGARGVEVLDRQQGDHIDLEVRAPVWRSWLSGAVRSIRVEISMPSKAYLDVEAGDGPVTVSGITGRINLHSSDGPISAEDLGGTVSLRSGDGAIDGVRLDGTLVARTQDGRIRVDGRFDDLRLKSDDGSIRAEARSGSRLGASWMLRTGDGHVVLRIAHDLQAELDAHTRDGYVTLDLPVQVTGRVSRSTVRGALNGGGPMLTLRSGDGAIRVERI